MKYSDGSKGVKDGSTGVVSAEDSVDRSSVATTPHFLGTRAQVKVMFHSLYDRENSEGDTVSVLDVLVVLIELVVLRRKERNLPVH